ncbi:hypothetical protein M378DRAFT_182941 [Amanita muscaria Koide BX008]|uniref:H/ACA ribonucleoprotein complex non-core subunit NAF1 n=1 Tax=Amanita muscaria (strain Koide BX008) TaxID=946122 RepID=A0A0C2T6F5_AMAMK|nr:hypothetical protein M378DRAFT_182941 [Amanita muscaria Koide BX008]
MDDFRVPHSIPQDLLLIQELVGGSLQPSHPTHATQHEDISSSSESDNDSIASEDEIERELMSKTTDDMDSPDAGPSVPSSDESDSEDESSASRAKNDTGRAAAANDEPDDDDEDAPTQSNNYLQTKNEVVNIPINIPDIAEVGHDEALEKVGEIISIVGNVAIVKGLASEVVNRGLGKALDADTLLVFNDRKVFGHIYETFGPTSQPFYQVRFNDAFPLDPEKVQVLREIFHVPRQSNYVFLRELKRLKGSDASNVHDEEPGEDELEFSDDEAEAAHRLRMKRKRSGSRASSQQPSSGVTPAYDGAEIPAYSGNAFDACGPYDADYVIRPPRPPPMPYEDPYSDAYNGVSSRVPGTMSHGEVASLGLEAIKVPERGRSTSRHPRGQPRGRGRGRGRGRRPSHGSGATWSPQPNLTQEGSVEPYSPHDPRLIAADSFGHMVPGQSGTAVPYAPMWPGFPQAQSFNFGAQQGYQHQPVVQPHINPRFASAFGFNMYPSAYTQMPQPSHLFDQSTRTDNWMLDMNNSNTSNQNGDADNHTS